MKPIIWGMDLREMRWSNFKSSYMFGNKDYHLRRTKFIVYQLAMIFCVVSESLGTAVLSKYVDQQSKIERLHSTARVHNNNYVGIASFNIFTGIYVATIFGGGFFFDLFFPDRWEPVNIRWWWRASAVFACMCILAASIGLTVITCDGKSWISASNADQRAIALEHIGPPLVYRNNGKAIASLVFAWLGFVSTVGATVVMFMFYRHYGVYGPRSAVGRSKEIRKETKGSQDSTSPNSIIPDSANASQGMGTEARTGA